MRKTAPSSLATKNPPYSGGEIAALAGSTVLAFAIPGFEAWRILPLSDYVISFVALVSMALSTLLYLRRPNGLAMLATFLPALPLAACVQLVQGGSIGAKLLAATALALQLRFLLLAYTGNKQRQREKKAIALCARIPTSVSVFVDNDIESEVKIDDLRENHVYRLMPGQIVPTDGLITYGSGFVDESLSAGEPANLRMKGTGDFVFAGSLNRNGTLLVRASSVGAQTFSAQLAARMIHGSECGRFRLLAMDAIFLVAAMFLLALATPADALQVFLLTSGTSTLAALAAFELGLAQVSCSRLWLWQSGGIRRLAQTGMLVLRADGVLSEGRPKLVAIESVTLSEDAVLGMMGPLARKLETPASFAVLQELRQRNIPLQQVELYQPHENGAIGIVASDEIHWVNIAQLGRDADFGDLSSFVEENFSAGDELHGMVREGKLEAVLAFRDSPVSGAAASVEELRSISLPILLVSSLPKRAVNRLQTELSLEHAQGETNEAETQLLIDRLAKEGLAPAWIQTSSFRPRRCGAVAALPLSPTGRDLPADLTALQLTLPALVDSLRFARQALRRLRSSLFWIYGAQTGMLIALFSANPRLAGMLDLGTGWKINASALALAGVLPGFVALTFSSPHAPSRKRKQAANLDCTDSPT